MSQEEETEVETCDWCGITVNDDTALYSLVTDPTGHDTLVTTCCQDHLDRLQQHSTSDSD